MNLSKLYQQENLFPRGFANFKETKYGILFYNEDIPNSYDANHAIILNYDCNLREAIENIKSFYLNLKIVPRIYQSFQSREEEKIFPLLKTKGFSIEEQKDNVLFIFDSKKKQLPDQIYPEVNRVADLSNDFVSLIRLEYKTNRMHDVIKRHLFNPNYYLFVYCLDHKPICIGSLNIMDSFSRIDDVLTHKEFRNRGIGTRLINHIVTFHSNISSNILYLYASDPTAIRIYKKLGFNELKENYKYWQASFDLSLPKSPISK
jgi:ribosomal protein S18 acetylase RimI-like enzyme